MPFPYILPRLKMPGLSIMHPELRAHYPAVGQRFSRKQIRALAEARGVAEEPDVKRFLSDYSSPWTSVVHEGPFHFLPQGVPKEYATAGWGKVTFRYPEPVKPLIRLPFIKPRRLWADNRDALYKIFGKDNVLARYR